MFKQNNCVLYSLMFFIFLLGFGFSEMLNNSKKNEEAKIEKKQNLDQSLFEMKTPNEIYTLNQPIKPKMLKDFYCRKNIELNTTYCERSNDLDRVILGLKAPDDEVVNIKHQIIVKNKEECESLITTEKLFLDNYWSAYRDMYAYIAVENTLENLNNKEKMKELDKIYILRKIPALMTYKYSATCTQYSDNKEDKEYIFTRFAMDKI